MDINFDKHIWEGWTVGDFIKDLTPMIENRINFRGSFNNRAEVKKWCMENQPYYKKYIKEVVDYFCTKLNIK